MENKEIIYDEKIAPLMAQIIEICKQNEIPMFADFQYSDSDFCTTCIYPDIEGRNVTIMLYNILSKCRNSEGVNIDQFIFTVGKTYGNTSSIALRNIGFEPKS
jgi:hypothetical protein